MKPPLDDDRFIATVELIRRCGARSFKIQFCEEDPPPVVWIASAQWGRNHWECGAGTDPITAVTRLAEEVVDGGTCLRCKRPTGLDATTDTMPLDAVVCWYQYDPSTRSYQRGCT